MVNVPEAVRSLSSVVVLQQGLDTEARQLGIQESSSGHRDLQIFPSAEAGLERIGWRGFGPRCSKPLASQPKFSRRHPEIFDLQGLHEKMPKL